MARAKHQAAWAERARQTGRRRVEVWLPVDALERLDALVRETGASGRGEALAELLTGTRKTAAKRTTAKADRTARKAPSRAPELASETAAKPTGATAPGETTETAPADPGGQERATGTTRRRRCPRSGDDGVETRRMDNGWDRFAVIMDGHQVGTVTKGRTGWRGETTAGHQVEGRVATAAVNRVLKAAHQAGLLELGTAPHDRRGAV